MPILVRLPNGGTATFPDGTTDEEIRAKLASISQRDIAPDSSNVEQFSDVGGRASAGIVGFAGGLMDMASPDAAPSTVISRDSLVRKLPGGEYAANAINRVSEARANISNAVGYRAPAAVAEFLGADETAKKWRDEGAALVKPYEEARADENAWRESFGNQSLEQESAGYLGNRMAEPVKEFGRGMRDFYTTDESKANAADFGTAVEGGMGSAAKFLVNPMNWATTADVIAPSLIETMVPSALAARTLKTGLMGRVASGADEAAARATAAGATELQVTAARTEAMVSGTVQAERTAQTAMLGGQAGQVTEMNARQQAEEFQFGDVATLRQNPIFARLEAEMGEEAARATLAARVFDASMAVGLPLNAAATILPGKLGLQPLETQLAGGVQRAGNAGMAARVAAMEGVRGRVARGVLHGGQEQLGEAIQEGTEQFGQNVAGVAAGSSDGYWDGVGTNAVVGAGAGFGAGGISGIVIGPRAPAALQGEALAQQFMDKAAAESPPSLLPQPSSPVGPAPAEQTFVPPVAPVRAPVAPVQAPGQPSLADMGLDLSNPMDPLEQQLAAAGAAPVMAEAPAVDIVGGRLGTQAEVEKDAAIVDAFRRRAEPATEPPAPQPRSEQVTESRTGGNPVAEIPLEGLGLSKDVPQFKAGANDDTGVVEPLGGTFDRRGVGPIQVWRRADGRMEVISGRHRLDLARRSGETTIPAQVYNEADGFTADKAAILDAELNIRDGQGKVKDYVQYFQSGISKDEADARGLLARSTGQRAYGIATQGSPDLIAAHQGDQITDEGAYQIAQNAPGEASLQNLGMRMLADGRSINVAVNTMRAAKAMRGPAAENGDLFGFDDSAIQDYIKMGQVASREERALSERIAAVRGASKRPDLARKEGVSIRNPKQLENKLRELTTEKARWDNWSSHADLVAQVRDELGIADPNQEVAPEPEPEPEAAPVNLGAGLFGAPSTKDFVDAATRDRDAARDGKTGTGRTDMLSGDGALFAGPAPEQADIEGEPMARRASTKRTPETAKQMRVAAKEMPEGVTVSARKTGGFEYANEAGDRIGTWSGPALSSEDQVTEAKAAAQVLADPAAAVAAYRALPDTKGGLVINTDEAREIFPTYSVNAEGRTKNALAVHEPSSYVAKRVWQEELARPVTEGKTPNVMFMAGGTGAGKTTAINRLDSAAIARDKADIIFDGNLSGTESSIKKIEDALKSGRTADVFYIARDPVEAFEYGAVPRANKESYGRTVPIHAHIGTHLGSAKTFGELIAHFEGNPNVTFTAYLNRQNETPVQISPDQVADIATMDYTVLEQKINERLEVARNEGRVADRVWNYYRPQAVQAVPAATDNRGRKGSKAEGDAGTGSLPQGDGQAGSAQPVTGDARGKGKAQVIDPELRALSKRMQVAITAHEILTNKGKKVASPTRVFNTVQEARDAGFTVGENDDGFYDQRTDTAGVIAENVTGGVDGALSRAWHERNHRGILTVFPTARALAAEMTRAGTNPTVDAVAKAIHAERGYDALVKAGAMNADETRSLSVEEALAELNSAVQTGNWTEVNDRYGVKADAITKRSVADVLRRMLRALRTAITGAGGKSSAYTNTDVMALLKKAHEVGLNEDKAKGGRATRAAVAFHGTPHTVDKFSLQKIGTGEGAQAYGHGLYFASLKEVADGYRVALTADESRRRFSVAAALASSKWFKPGLTVNGKKYYDRMELQGDIDRRDLTSFDMPTDVAKVFTDKLAEPIGNTYRVDIPEDTDLLDWDKPLSEQPEKVRAALKIISKDDLPEFDPFDNLELAGLFGEHPRDKNYNPTGRDIYRGITDAIGSDKGASEFLNSIGVPGVRYLDGTSRSKGEGSANYVIWDEAQISAPTRASTKAPFNESAYRAPVVEWARSKFGDRVAPNGKPAWQNFVEWFGDSKVVDKDGAPLTIYHGTAGNFDAFLNEKLGSSTGANSAKAGHWLVADPDVANGYAHYAALDAPVRQKLKAAEAAEKKAQYASLAGDSAAAWKKYDEALAEAEDMETEFQQERNRGQSIIPAHVALKNPIILEADGAAYVDFQGEINAAIRKMLRTQEFDGDKYIDGIIVRELDDHPSRDGLVSDHFLIREPEQVKSSTANAGNFSPDDGNIRASTRNPLTPAARQTWRDGRKQAIADKYANRGQALNELAANGMPQGSVTWNANPAARETALRKARRTFQDRMIDARDIQDAISDAIGQDLPDFLNLYQEENLMHGKAEEGIRAFQEKFSDPLKAAIKASGLSNADIHSYLWAKHAEERNKLIASRNPKMPDGGSGLTTAEANQRLADFTAKGLTPKLEAIGKRVQSIRHNTLDTLLRSGQITPEQHNSLSTMFKHYVPLRGNPKAEQGEGRVGGGKGLDMRGKPTQRALGRNSEPSNILGELVGDAERAIVQGAKAEVGRTLLRMALAFPNPGVWKVEPVTLEQKFSEATGEVYMAAVGGDPEQSVIVKHNGKPYTVVLVDPRLRDAVQNYGLEGLDMLPKLLGWANRWLSKTMTTFNPAFTAVNMIRDAIQGSIAIGSELGGAALMDTGKHYFPAMAAMWNTANGGGDSSVADGQKKMVDWAREYAEQGGKTGYATMTDPETMQERIENEMAGIGQLIKDRKPVAAISQALQRSALIQGVERANDAVENAMRLAVYVQQRKAGTSKAKAAQYSKNVTINFNRRGQATSAMNALYLFFNASVQGGHRTLSLLSDKRVLGGMAALGATQGMVAMSLGMMKFEDDDETLWEQIPDYVRERAFVIPLGFGKDGDPQYFAIPMPYGFNMFTAVGGFPALAASPTWRSRQEHGVPAMFINTTARTAIDAFSVMPIGEDGWLWPTLMRMQSNFAANKDDFGGSIRSPQAERANVPKASAGKADTPEAYKAIATAMNRLGGGDEVTKPVNWLDYAPEDIEYMMKLVTGGIGGTLQQTYRAVSRGAAGLDLSAGDIPIANRVLGSQRRERVVTGMYYDASSRMDKGLERLRGAFVENGVEGFEETKAKLGPAFDGVVIARYRTSSRDKGYRRGQLRIDSDTGRPTLMAVPGSVFSAYKQVKRDSDDFGSDIRATFTSDLAGSDRLRSVDALQVERASEMRKFLDVWNRANR